MKDVIIGIDAGTSLIKSVAFDLTGKQIATFSLPNKYEVIAGAGAEQDIARTWRDTAAALRGLAETVPGLSTRTAALAVTGQGDGTWLIDKDNQPVAPGWLWLDARAAAVVVPGPYGLKEHFGDPEEVVEFIGDACILVTQLAPLSRNISPASRR